MIGGAPVFPIVGMIACKMAVDIMPVQYLGHGIVKGLQRAPAPVEKIAAPRVEFPPGGHTGEAPRVTVFKTDSMLRKPGKVWGNSITAPIRIEEAPV
jgi:hypothetical protein